MSGAGYGHGGPVGEIFDVLPLDTTFHVTDCGYDDNDQRCGCYDLPAKLRKIIAKAVAEAIHEAADVLAATTDGMVTEDAARGNDHALAYVNCTRIDADWLHQHARSIEAGQS